MSPADRDRQRREQLRSAAESAVGMRPAEPAQGETQAQRLMHELQVHQVELEMQNESLRQAQSELETSRDRYLDLYEFAPVAFLTLDPAGLISQTNLTAVTLLGRERGRLLRRRLAALVAEHDQPRWVRFFQRARQMAGTSSIELALRRGDGTLLQVRLDCGAQKAGTAGGAIQVVLHDIDARSRAQAALAASEARYRDLFEGNPLPMWVYELASQAFLAVNDAAVDQYGYSREEFLAMTIRDIRPPDDLDRLQDAAQQPMAEGIHHSGQWRHLRKDGSLIVVEITSHDLDFDHRPSRLVLANDVTERELAAAELRQQRDALERFNSVAVDREVEMIRLKQQVNALSRQLGQAAPFDLDFIDDPTAFEGLYASLPDEGAA